MLVVSSTAYNEMPSEPTIVAVPILGHDPDTGFGVLLGAGVWAAPGLATSLRKAALSEFRRRAHVQALTGLTNMLFRILATPDR